MLLIQVTYTMLPGKREEFLKRVRETGILSAIRGEEGCLGYSYYLPEEEDGTLLLLERWIDAQAQKNHLATAHMEEMRRMKPEYVSETKIVSWETEE